MAVMDKEQGTMPLWYRPYRSYRVEGIICAELEWMVLLVLGIVAESSLAYWACLLMNILILHFFLFLFLTALPMVAILDDSGIRITGLKKDQDVYYSWEVLPYVYWTANYKAWERFVLAERPLTDREVRRAANKLERFKNFRSGIIALPPGDRAAEVKEIIRRHVREERNVTNL